MVESTWVVVISQDSLPAKMVTCFRNNQARSWLGIAPAAEIRKSNVLATRSPLFESCICYPLHNESSTSCVYSVVHKSFIFQSPELYLRPDHTSHQHTNTLIFAHLQQWQPLSSTDRPPNRKPCVLCLCTLCVVSVTDRSETDLVVDNNIQESFNDISCQLSIHLTLIMECAIVLTVRDTLQCSCYCYCHYYLTD